MRIIAGVEKTDKQRKEELREDRGRTEIEMGGLGGERFGGSGKGLENESGGWGSGDSWCKGQ